MPEYWIALDGNIYEKDKVSGDISDALYTCYGCGRKMGQYHEEGCDHETCPRCFQQAIACNCDLLEMPIFDVDDARTTIRLLQEAIDAIGRGDVVVG